MSRSLVKLIDVALFPAALMALGKLVGLVFTLSIFGIEWSLKDIPASFFSVRPVVWAEDLIVASTYSDLVMYMFLAVGFSFILVQATHFHDTHINPRTLMQLSNSNLLGLVKSSFDIYHSAVIWLAFVWVAGGLVWVNALLGKTELWVGLICLIANIIFSSLLLQDVYREIDISKRSLGNQQALS